MGNIASGENVSIPRARDKMGEKRKKRTRFINAEPFHNLFSSNSFFLLPALPRSKFPLK